MKSIPDSSIDCCITSPPYWALRDYQLAPQVWDGEPNCEHEWKCVAGFQKIGRDDLYYGGNVGTKGLADIKPKKNAKSDFCSKCNAWLGSLGLEPTFDLYIKHLCDVFDEVKRVLKEKGTCWVVLGDTYWGGGHGGASKDRAVKSVLQGESSNHVPAIDWGNSYQSKCLCLVPFRFAIEMVSRGWLLRNTIIWHKPNCMPSSAKDRFTVDFEYVLFFVKNRKYFFEQQTEPLNPVSIKRYEYSFEGSYVPGSAYPKEVRKKPQGWTNPDYKFPDYRNKRCVWTISTEPCSEPHYAPYPQKLIETPIKAGCPKGGIVLDPFAGTGTTGVVAKKLERNFILIELNPAYCEIAKRRLRRHHANR